MRLIKEFNESITYLTEESKDPKKPNVFTIRFKEQERSCIS